MNFSKLLRTVSLATVLTFGQPTTTLSKIEPVKAQSSARPYVVLANGYQDCCAWYMDTVVQEFESMGAEIRRVPWDSFTDKAEQRSDTSSDSDFINQGISVIGQLDRNRPIILIGHSYGADSLIKLASRVTNRQILFLGVIDPVAGGGLRAPVRNYTVTDNVHYFFNRWQENGLAGDNVVPFDSRISGNIGNCDAAICDQQEQSLARNADGSSTRISCEAHEVTCEGWRLPGCNFSGCWSGSNGTKQKRMYHNDMADDAYIQQQIIEKVNTLLVDFTPPQEGTGSEGRHVPPTQNLGDRITSHREMPEGSYLQSGDGRFKMVMQGDGNLVIYQSGVGAIYASNTDGTGSPTFKLAMQSDGNLVIYGSGGATWASNTNGVGQGPYTLVMQNDGNLVIYDRNGAIWASNTCCR